MKCKYLDSLEDFTKKVLYQQLVFGRCVIEKKDDGQVILDHTDGYKPIYAIIYKDMK